MVNKVRLLTRHANDAARNVTGVVEDDLRQKAEYHREHTDEDDVEYDDAGEHARAGGRLDGRRLHGEGHGAVEHVEVADVVEVWGDHPIPLAAVPQVERARAHVDDGVAQHYVRVDDDEDADYGYRDGLHLRHADVRDVHGEEERREECVPRRRPNRCLKLDFHGRSILVIGILLPHHAC